MKVGKFWAQNLHLGRNGSPETLIDLGRDSQWLQDNHAKNSNKEKLETKKRRIHISFQMSPVMNEPFSVWQALFSAKPPHQQDDDAKISCFTTGPSRVLIGQWPVILSSHWLVLVSSSSTGNWRKFSRFCVTMERIETGAPRRVKWLEAPSYKWKLIIIIPVSMMMSSIRQWFSLP